MFKNLSVYRIALNVEMPTQAQMEELLSAQPFEPCGPTQVRSVGWTPPRAVEHAALLESVGGQWMLRLMIEKKSVPAGVVAEKLKERLAQIERETGREPRGKRKREVKDEVIQELLPNAFPKRSSVGVWVDRAAGLVYIESATGSVIDQVITLLGANTPLRLENIDTVMSPSGAMATWLARREVSDDFAFAGECELQDSERATVKYVHHRLDIDEIVAHIAAGKVPKALALAWHDKVAFSLSKAGVQLKKVRLIDVDMGKAGDADDPFDANVAIFTAELSALVPHLLEALGGERPAGQEEGGPAQSGADAGMDAEGQGDDADAAQQPLEPILS